MHGTKILTKPSSSAKYAERILSFDIHKCKNESSDDILLGFCRNKFVTSSLHMFLSSSVLALWSIKYISCVTHFSILSKFSICLLNCGRICNSFLASIKTKQIMSKMGSICGDQASRSRWQCFWVLRMSACSF